jgi:hypothetical protein
MTGRDDLRTVSVDADDEYGAQLYVSDERPARGDMDPIANQEANLRKPSGGLWTSTHTGDGTLSSWVSWAAGENFYDGSEKAWRLTLTAGTELLVIDGRQDLADIVDVYPREAPHQAIHEGPGIDYEATSDYHDGIWLTAEGQRETRLASKGTVTLYGWDVESTLWFNWRFASVEPLGDIMWTSHPHYREYP